MRVRPPVLCGIVAALVVLHVARPVDAEPDPAAGPIRVPAPATLAGIAEHAGFIRRDLAFEPADDDSDGIPQEFLGIRDIGRRSFLLQRLALLLEFGDFRFGCAWIFLPPLLQVRPQLLQIVRQGHLPPKRVKGGAGGIRCHGLIPADGAGFVKSLH